MQKAHSNINWENLPSKNTPLGAYLLNKQDREIDVIDDRVLSLYGYESRVAESEKNAKESEINAKASETNAKQSELKAKEYMENAFSGTPEGYDKLLEDVRLMDIQTTTDTILANSKAGGYKLLSMRCKSEQKQYTGKNLLNCTLGTTTSNGITCTYNGDGTYTLNGTVATGNYEQFTLFRNKISAGTYKLVGNPDYSLGCSLYFEGHGDKEIDYGNGSIVNFASDENANLYLYIPSGVTLTNVVFKPMLTTDLNATYDDFEPYVGGIPSPNPDYPQSIENVGDCVEIMQGVYEASSGVFTNSVQGVCSKNEIPCQSGDSIVIGVPSGLYTNIRVSYFNGDSYLSDAQNQEVFTVPSNATSFKFSVINYNTNITPDTVGKISLTINGKYVVQVKSVAYEPYKETVATVLLNEPLRDGDILYKEDGLFKVERNSSVFVPKSVEGFDSTGKLLIFNLNDSKKWLDGLNKPNILCNCLSVYSLYDLRNHAHSGISQHDINFTIKNTAIEQTVDAYNEWLSSANVVIEYKLATPIVETLDTDSQIALNSLETFDVVTYISVDSRTQPSEIVGEYGTSNVGARTIKNELKNDTLEIKYNELSVALVATESGV